MDFCLGRVAHAEDPGLHVSGWLVEMPGLLHSMEVELKGKHSSCVLAA